MKCKNLHSHSLGLKRFLPRNRSREGEVCKSVSTCFTQEVQWEWSVLFPEVQRVPYGLLKSTCVDCYHPAESPVQPKHKRRSLTVLSKRLLNSHKRNILITSRELNSIQKNKSGYSKKQKCCWECVVYVLTVPGGGGSAPVWQQHSHHVDPWTPHLELHTWALVKDSLDIWICIEMVLLDILATGFL